MTINHCNYSGLCLAMQEWAEAAEHLHVAWRLAPSKTDRFGARTLFLRAALAAVRGEDPDLFFGQLKALLDGGIQPAPSRNITVLELLLILRSSLSWRRSTMRLTIWPVSIG